MTELAEKLPTLIDDSHILKYLIVPRRDAAQRRDQALLFHLAALDYISSPGRRKTQVSSVSSLFSSISK